MNAYVADMAKYTSESESAKVRNAFRSMPAQLAKENKKFQYKLIRKGATAGLFGDSIAWLVSAGVVLPCDRVTRAELPLVAFRDVSAFKLYLSDVGLLTAFTGIYFRLRGGAPLAEAASRGAPPHRRKFFIGAYLKDGSHIL